MVDVAGRDGRDPLGQLALLLDVVQVGDVGHLRSLVLHRLHPIGVGVSQGVDGYAGNEIEILLPVRPVQVASLAVGEGQLDPAVVVEQVSVALLFRFLECHDIIS